MKLFGHFVTRSVYCPQQRAINCKLSVVAVPLLHIEKPVHKISVNLCQRKPKVGDKLNISPYTMVVTRSKHISYIPNGETQYIVLIKLGYLISKLPFSPGISCNKTAIMPGGTRHFRSCGTARHPGSSLQESCPLARRTVTPEWLPRVKMLDWENEMSCLDWHLRYIEDRMYSEITKHLYALCNWQCIQLL